MRVYLTRLNLNFSRFHSKRLGIDDATELVNFSGCFRLNCTLINSISVLIVNQKINSKLREWNT